MYFLEDRKRAWLDYLTKKGLNFILKDDLPKIKKKIINPLILPSPLFNEDFIKELKEKFEGEIYTEVLNLFYFMKKSFDKVDSNIFFYNLDLINDKIVVEFLNIENYKKENLTFKGFTPKGIEEYLKFNNFKLIEIWGDKPLGKIKESSKFLLLRIKRI